MLTYRHFKHEESSVIGNGCTYVHVQWQAQESSDLPTRGWHATVINLGTPLVVGSNLIFVSNAALLVLTHLKRTNSVLHMYKKQRRCRREGGVTRRRNMRRRMSREGSHGKECNETQLYHNCARCRKIPPSRTFQGRSSFFGSSPSCPFTW